MHCMNIVNNVASLQTWQFEGPPIAIIINQLATLGKKEGGGGGGVTLMSYIPILFTINSKTFSRPLHFLNVSSLFRCHIIMLFWCQT